MDPWCAKYPKIELLEGTYCGPTEEVNGRQVPDTLKRDVGKKWFTSGARYVGEYRNGMRSGRGSFIFPSGNIYVGQYQHGLKNGHGAYFHQDSAKWTWCRYVEDKPYDCKVGLTASSARAELSQP